MTDFSRQKSSAVGLFATCLVELMRPEVGFASVQLLQSAGCTVQVPSRQTCCGQPLFNSGDPKRTRKLAKKLLSEFSEFDYVVVPSGSCAAMIKIHYPELFAADARMRRRAQAVASITYELTQFLDAVVPTQLQASFDGSCTYHDSCSGLRELGIHRQPRRLLTQIAGLRLTECTESTACCGFGGTFCVKYPQISARIATEKAQNIEQTSTQILLGGDLGCLLHIAGTLSRRQTNIEVRHVAEMLAGCSGPPIGRSKT